MNSFSLIIPIFNSPKDDRRPLIDELLESIPDREDLEILLVDDHSSLDYTPVRVFQHATLQLFSNDVGAKFAGSARNVGLRSASGDFLIFADSDDLFDTEGLERVMDALTWDDETDLAIARSTSFCEDGQSGDRHHHVDRIIDAYSVSGHTDALLNYHAPWGKVVRRATVEKNGLVFGNTRVANDVLFGVGIALKATCVRLFDQTIYQIRQGNVCLTADLSDEAVSIRISVGREVHRLLLSAGRGDQRAPLHYHFRRYLRTHPHVVVRHAFSAIMRGERVVSPPAKMIRTILNAWRSTGAK